MGLFDTIANVATLGGYDALDMSGNKATQGAINAQTQGVNQANDVMKNEYQVQMSLMHPTAQIGNTALSQLAGNNFMQNWQQDPGYQFQLEQGQNAINNAAAARGMGNSGATLKALAGYNQQMASQAYDKAYDRESSRLGQLAGYGQNANQNLMQASQNFGNTVSGNYTGLGNANAAAQIAQSNRNAQMMGQGIGLGATALSFSDRRLKKNIIAIPKEDLDELRSELKAFYWEYKDVLHGDPGRHVGIMAQDLEKSKLGKEIVVEVDGKKMIDMNRVLNVFLATMAEAA